MENIPQPPQNPNDLPDGKIHNMEDDIRASMPQIELREGDEQLVPPLPRLDLFSPDDRVSPPAPEEHVGSHKKVILGSIISVVAILLVGGGGFYFWKMGGNTELVVTREESILEEEPLETTTPFPDEVPEETPEATPTPVVYPGPLSQGESILKNASARTIVLSSTSQDAVLEAIYGIEGIPESGFALLSFAHETGTPLLTSLGEFSEIFGLKLPAALLDEATLWQLYVYNSGAKEKSFCAAIQNSDCAGKRISLVLKVASGSVARAHMQAFESTASSSLASLIIPAINRSSYTGFRTAGYKGITLRYFNFPITPEKQASSITSLNYAVVSRAGEEYLVLGTSRLSFYAMIDSLMEVSN